MLAWLRVWLYVVMWLCGSCVSLCMYFHACCLYDIHCKYEHIHVYSGTVMCECVCG